MQTSRRSFLQFVAASSLGAGLAGQAMAQPTNKPQRWNMSVDVVVIGAGGAGLCCAATLAEAGKKVVLLESQPLVGGSTKLCGGQFAAVGTDLQKAKNIPDTRERFINDMMVAGGGANDRALVEKYVDNTLETYNWFKTLGIKASVVQAASGMSEPRAHVFNAPKLIEDLEKYAKSKGVKIIVDCRAGRLVMDEGRITGVKAVRRGKEMWFEGKQGVVITTGGFSHNKAMLRKYRPLLANAHVISTLGAQGDGLLMAQAYGADVIDTPYLTAMYGYKPNAQSIKDDFSMIFYAGAVMINDSAKRFCNESLPYRTLADYALGQKDGKSWLIFTEEIRKNAVKGNHFDRHVWSIVDRGEKADWFATADSVEALATKIGLNPQELKRTVETYNKGIENGTDEFGRKYLSGAVGKPVPLKNGPFYAYPATSVLITTYAGLKVNADNQVVDIFGDVIPGLYSAGECVGGYHGKSSVSGTAFGKSTVTGRLVAKKILAAR